jgi:hypothetical protein
VAPTPGVPRLTLGRIFALGSENVLIRTVFRPSLPGRPSLAQPIRYLASGTWHQVLGIRHQASGIAPVGLGPPDVNSDAEPDDLMSATLREFSVSRPGGGAGLTSGDPVDLVTSDGSHAGLGPVVGENGDAAGSAAKRSITSSGCPNAANAAWRRCSARGARGQERERQRWGEMTLI